MKPYRIVPESDKEFRETQILELFHAYNGKLQAKTVAGTVRLDKRPGQNNGQTVRNFLNGMVNRGLLVKLPGRAQYGLPEMQLAAAEVGPEESQGEPVVSIYVSRTLPFGAGFGLSMSLETAKYLTKVLLDALADK